MFILLHYYYNHPWLWTHISVIYCSILLDAQLPVMYIFEPNETNEMSQHQYNDDMHKHSTNLSLSSINHNWADTFIHITHAHIHGPRWATYFIAPMKQIHFWIIKCRIALTMCRSIFIAQEMHSEINTPQMAEITSYMTKLTVIPICVKLNTVKKL